MKPEQRFELEKQLHKLTEPAVRLSMDAMIVLFLFWLHYIAIDNFDTWKRPEEFPSFLLMIVPILATGDVYLLLEIKRALKALLPKRKTKVQ